MALKIPDDFPLSKLVAQELTQICIGSSEVRLNFYQPATPVPSVASWSEGASIQIESGFSLRGANGSIQTSSSPDIGLGAGCLISLLRQRISDVRRLANNELLVVFATGAELHLLIDPSGFESYHLYVDNDSAHIAAP